MHDDLVAYPGKISITISGTAASAATVLAMAADTLEMTPGSLFMIHDPIVGAIGNEADLMEAIGLLRACKDSIINVYATRTLAGRDQIAQMMKETTWMDDEAALAYGFIDRIAAPSAFGTVINCAVAREVAEKKVQLWVDRHKQLVSDIRKKEQTVNPEEDRADDHEAERLPLGEAGVPATAEDAPAAPPEEAPAPEPADEPVETGEAEAPDNSPGADHPDGHDTGTPVSQLRKRLALIMPSEARK
jgi:ATP-dependent Clp protease protease subunit